MPGLKGQEKGVRLALCATCLALERKVPSVGDLEESRPINYSCAVIPMNLGWKISLCRTGHEDWLVRP